MCNDLVVELFELEIRGEADEKLGGSPLDRGDQVSTAVERVNKHGGSLGSVELGDDVGPLVEVRSTAKDVGKVGILTAKVPGTDGGNANHGGSLRKSVANLVKRMDSKWRLQRSVSGLIKAIWTNFVAELTGRDMFEDAQMADKDGGGSDDGWDGRDDGGNQRSNKANAGAWMV